jgi:hypothetical protein
MKQKTRYLWQLYALRDKARAQGNKKLELALSELIAKKKARAVNTGGGRDSAKRQGAIL